MLFRSSGAKLSTLPGPAGKIDQKKLAEALAQPVYGVVHHPQPAAVSITQATECGTVYGPDEIVSIATTAHRHGLKLHMDGARFANALAFVGCSAAELSWMAGVDALSLGATKNGALAAEYGHVRREQRGQLAVCILTLQRLCDAIQKLAACWKTI